MSTTKRNIVFITSLPLILISFLILHKNVFALDIPSVPNIPDWKSVEVNIDIPTIPPLPTIPPMPTLGWTCDCTPTPTKPHDNPTPTPSTPPPPPPPPGGGGGNGGDGGGGGSSSGGGGEVLGATTYAPTGGFAESLMYASLILGLVFVASSTQYGRRLISSLQ